MSVLRDVVVSIVGAMAARWVMKKIPSVGVSALEEPVVAERFAPQPFAVYHERIVWELTPDCDVVQIRKTRNFLNRNEDLVRRAYEAQVAPGVAARQIGDSGLIHDDSALAPPIDWLLPKYPEPEPPPPAVESAPADDGFDD